MDELNSNAICASILSFNDLRLILTNNYFHYENLIIYINQINPCLKSKNFKKNHYLLFEQPKIIVKYEILNNIYSELSQHYSNLNLIITQVENMHKYFIESTNYIYHVTKHILKSLFNKFQIDANVNDEFDNNICNTQKDNEYCNLGDGVKEIIKTHELNNEIQENNKTLEGVLNNKEQNSYTRNKFNNNMQNDCLGNVEKINNYTNNKSNNSNELSNNQSKAQNKNACEKIMNNLQNNDNFKSIVHKEANKDFMTNIYKNNADVDNTSQELKMHNSTINHYKRSSKRKKGF